MFTVGSSVGTGGVLVQEEDEQERVVAYTSRSLTKREERNISATELELLTVKHALKAFRPYLEGSQFELVTDHVSLKWLLDQKDPKGRFARWANEQQNYDFTVTDSAGIQMPALDALSRYPFDVKVDLIDLPLEAQGDW